MHKLKELISHCTEFTIKGLEEVNSKIIESLQTSGTTSHVKGLQIIQLQKTIFIVGVFSLFESIIQDSLSCKDGFIEVKKILLDKGNNTLYNKFNDYYLAINVLKYGRGNSYNRLVDRSESLPFKIKLEDEYFFQEGDVSEIKTLIEVDDGFILECANLLVQVCNEIELDKISHTI